MYPPNSFVSAQPGMKWEPLKELWQEFLKRYRRFPVPSVEPDGPVPSFASAAAQYQVVHQFDKE